MPKNSYLGNRDTTATVNALAAYTYSEADAVAAVTAIPAGGTTLTLPPAPSDGDWYEWADEDGTCSATNPLIIAAGAGSTIRGQATIESAQPYAAGRVRYFAKEDSWAVISQTAANASTVPNYSQGKAASGAAVAAGGVIVSTVLTPKVSGKVVVSFSAGWTAPGAGVVTPILQHTSTAGTVVDFTFPQFATLAECIGCTIEIDGLTLGTAYTFEGVTTAGDHALVLGITASPGSGAVIRASELGS
jgi:hypothetical protein